MKLGEELYDSMATTVFDYGAQYVLIIILLNSWPWKDPEYSLQILFGNGQETFLSCSRQRHALDAHKTETSASNLVILVLHIAKGGKQY